MKLTKSQKKLQKRSQHIQKLSGIDPETKRENLFTKFISNIKELKNKVRTKIISTKHRIETGSYAEFENLKDVKNFIVRNLDFVILVGFLIFLVYANSLGGAFVSDDIGAMELIKTKSWGELLSIGGYNFGLYKILYMLFRGDSWPFHLMSVLYHWMAVTLAFIFLAQYFPKKVTMLATLLFAFHPVNTEAVSWISGNIYLIDASILFISITLNNLYSKTNKLSYYFTMLGLFALPIIFGNNVRTIALIPSLIVIDIFFQKKKINLQLVYKYIPYLLVASVILIRQAAYTVNRITELNYSEQSINKANYFVRLIYSIHNPLELLFIPDRLALYHEGDVITQSLIAIMAVTTGLLFLYLLINLKRNKLKAGLILLALASLSYSLSPIQISWYYADRYIYVSSLAFAVLVVLWLTKLELKLKIKNFALITSIIILCLYSVRIYVRNLDWRNSKALWESNVRVHPKSARSYNNLGDVYINEGDIEKSLNAFKKAVELNPNYSDALHNLGLTQIKAQQYDDAKKNLEKAFTLNGKLYQAKFNLAYIYYLQKDYATAREYMKAVKDINPEYPKIDDLIRELARLELEAKTNGKATSDAGLLLQ